MHLGTAFQLVDDILDYSANAELLGKNIGDDLAEGKPTLPLIYAMQKASQPQTEQIRKAIKQGDGLEYIDDILATLSDTKALDFTMAKAQEEAKKAIAQLDVLPQSDYKQALIALAEISVDRDY